MPQRGGDFRLGEVGAVVALDQQRHPVGFIDVPRPAQGLVQQGKLLVGPIIPFQRRYRLPAARPPVNPISHVSLPDMKNPPRRATPPPPPRAPRPTLPPSV